MAVVTPEFVSIIIMVFTAWKVVTTINCRRSSIIPSSDVQEETFLLPQQDHDNH